MHPVALPESESPYFVYVAAFIAAIGAFLFGWSLGFTGPSLTAMEVLKDKNDAPLGFDSIQYDKGTVTIVSTNADLFSSMVNIGAMVGSLLAGCVAVALALLAAPSHPIPRRDDLEPLLTRATRTMQ